MNGETELQYVLTRRDLLKGLGLAGAALAFAPLLSACGVGGSGSKSSNNAAAAVTGSFDWQKAKGKTIRVLRTPHAYVTAFDSLGLYKEFTDLTGIEVKLDDIPEGDYFTKLTSELQGASGTHDVFMTGAYFIWQYGPPGWMEDLNPWLKNSAATNPDYDFEDIFEGLRTSTRWDFKNGSPLGSGGQYAIPWGFETNVIAYNKEVFDKRGIKPAETLDNLMQLAVDLTDRSKGTYGIAFRGSKSWATIHPGFMTQFTREGAKDYTVNGDKLTPVMNSDKAIAFTKKWVQMAKTAGPSGWTSYEYPQCTQDLADGKAMMVYDADSATFPKNKGTAVAGKLAWHPGPAGPDGSYATNLWTWALAMNSVAKEENKLAAWLFIQYCTSKEALNKAAATGNFADPVRKSVFDGAFKQSIGDKYPGYLETFEKVIGSTKIQFTPQTKFFETTENWASALQDIYGGQDAKSRLDALVKADLDTVNA